jgi:hypothetical protein
LNYPARIFPRTQILGTWRLVRHVAKY